MFKIMTITFNPCIDKSFSIDKLRPETKLACTPPYREPGGGGINVARAIHKLGGQACAIFPAGGYLGETLVELLAIEGVPVKPIKTMADTRENVNVVESSTGRQYRFILPGPPLQRQYWEACLDDLQDLDEGGFVIVSVSLPDKQPDDIFIRIKAIAETKKAFLIVDTSGPALTAALRAGVFLVKPSLRELETLAAELDLRRATVAEKAKELIDRGHASAVLVSAGAEGATLVTTEGSWEFDAPQVRKLTTIGAGDCLVAGTVWKLSLDIDLPEAVRYGVACAAAAVMNPGTALCRREDADTIYVNMPMSRLSYDPAKNFFL